MTAPTAGALLAEESGVSFAGSGTATVVGAGSAEGTVRLLDNTTAALDNPAEGTGAEVTADVVSEISNTITRARQTIGNDGMFVSSKNIAENVAEQFVGDNARPIYDRVGNMVGKISEDGTKIARYTSIEKLDAYINLENKPTGGNLHIRWLK